MDQEYWKVNNQQLDGLIEDILQITNNNSFCISLIHHLTFNKFISDNLILTYGFLCQLSCTIYSIFIRLPGMLKENDSILSPLLNKYDENIIQLCILIIKSKLFEKNIDILDKIFKENNINNITKEITKLQYPDDIWSKLLDKQNILSETYQICIENVITNIYKLTDVLNRKETNKIPIKDLYVMFQNNMIDFQLN